MAIAAVPTGKNGALLNVPKKPVYIIEARTVEEKKVK